MSKTHFRNQHIGLYSSGDTEIQKRFSVRIPVKLHTRAKQLAKERGIGLGDLIRSLLERELTPREEVTSDALEFLSDLSEHLSIHCNYPTVQEDVLALQKLKEKLGGKG